MKRIILMLAVLFSILVVIPNAQAVGISASGSGSEDGETYSFLFTITQEASHPDIFDAVLSNTSNSSQTSGRIDLLAFNIDAIMGSNFAITYDNPDWSFASGGGSGYNYFDYTGSTGYSSRMLDPGESLTFKFDFVGSFVLPSDPYTLWTDTSESNGRYLPDGSRWDYGQVAVHFNHLGDWNNDCATITANWDPHSNPVPEPSTVILLGVGLIGFLIAGRKAVGRKTSKM
jgi:hypothetical protein